MARKSLIIVMVLLGQTTLIGTHLGTADSFTSSAPSQFAKVTLPFLSGPSTSPSSIDAVRVERKTNVLNQLSSAQPPNITRGFEGIAYGFFNPSTPPDPHIAVSPNYVFEFVNSEGAIWNKQGSRLQTFYLTSFFGTSIFDTVGDSRVIFDSPSNRWFSSSLDVSSGKVYLSVSKTSDPTGAWWKFSFAAASTCPDQPLIGTSDDKFIISVNDYQGCSASASFVGAQYWVFNKNNLLNGTDIHTTVGPDSTLFSVHPVQSLSSTSTLYMASDWWGYGSLLRVFSIEGTPPGQLVTVTKDIPISFVQPLTSAPQKGTTNLLDLHDGRILDAKWTSGTLWVTLNDSCTPASDIQNRSCIRLIEIDSKRMTKTQDFDFGASGKYYFYPALSEDGLRNLLIVFGFSSQNDYPSLAVASQILGDAAGTVEAPVTIQVGSGSEQTGCTNGVCRYGDYFGAVLDPSDPTLVWVVGEYGKSSGWDTWIAALSVYRPRGQILIGSDHGFSTSNGVISGDGTTSNPYLIEGWQINGTLQYALQVANTTASFVVRTLYIHGTSAQPVKKAVIFGNVTNGEIRYTSIASAGEIGVTASKNLVFANNTITSIGLQFRIDSSRNITLSNNSLGPSGADYAVFVYGSNNLNVENNYLSNDAFRALELSFTANATISGNVFRNNIEAIFAYLTNGIRIFNNTLTNSNGPSILVSSGNGTTISSNFFSNNTRDTTLQNSNNTLIKNNIFALGASSTTINSQAILGVISTQLTIEGNLVSNHADGIQVTNGTNVLVRYNNITGNSDFGLSFAGTNLTVYGNNFVGNGLQATGTDDPSNVWDSGYPGGGNFWSDYAGIDSCSGPNQDICSVSDGIGDTPYAIPGTTIGQDNYPLIQPYFSDSSAPTWPGGSALILSGAGGTSVGLNWTTAIDDGRIIDYRVYENSALVVTVPAYVHSYNVTGLVPTTTYSFKIEALDASNNLSVGGPSSIRLPGDLNHDGAVNIVDLVMVGAAFGSTSSSNNWNPSADVNGDGKVDISDLVIVGSNFGRTCP